ncbi:MAG: hypothetical protein HQ567_24590 [Candidatus Nealsonbacteria bacterium]|nr:hypothetical protein [Candidatus Nealsonbacteria bacterium]
MFEESGQEVLVAAQGGQRIGCLLIQMVYVSGGEVGLASVLDVAPRAFDRIQLRAIATNQRPRCGSPKTDVPVIKYGRTTFSRFQGIWTQESI